MELDCQATGEYVGSLRVGGWRGYCLILAIPGCMGMMRHQRGLQVSCVLDWVVDLPTTPMTMDQK